MPLHEDARAAASEGARTDQAQQLLENGGRWRLKVGFLQVVQGPLLALPNLRYRHADLHVPVGGGPRRRDDGGFFKRILPRCSCNETVPRRRGTIGPSEEV